MEISKSFTPSNLADWRKWLAKNHDREHEVWLVYFKAAGDKTNIDYESSVEEALCFGWIDSIIQKIDEEKYARKFNPRRMESKWSETNKRPIVKMPGKPFRKLSHHSNAITSFGFQMQKSWRPLSGGCKF
jgi:uncharacterized protein YdeI (YjbR/CyaY-like superfamily)